MEIKLTPAERSKLRADAHALDPVVMIGADGLTPAVLKEIDANLKAHELIKVRVLGDDREQRAAFMDRICGALDAAPVQHIGKLLVVWRAKPTETRKPRALPTIDGKRTGRAPRHGVARPTSARTAGGRAVGRTSARGADTTSGAAPRKSAARPESGTSRKGAAPREVLLVKPSRTGKRPPTRRKVTLLGNQRVTAGGMIKRAKPRQKSVKKRGSD